ncbi:MAG: HTTM domain-containing protein, partial [Okeania sp. SIO2D1]|nr:HTTM domain-containing protein [Okeania sp. SIO2D1]
YWTEEGHRFAWHMKLRDKSAQAEFVVTSPQSNTVWLINPDQYLTSWQTRKMATRPEMILQFSHYLAKQKGQEGYQDVEVRATVMASLNGREPQLLVDPEVNLVTKSRSWWPADWILPF